MPYTDDSLGAFPSSPLPAVPRPCWSSVTGTQHPSPTNCPPTQHQPTDDVFQESSVSGDTTKLNAWDMHDTLWDAIKNTLKYNKEKEKGKIYVFRDPNSRTSIYKIGFTTQPIGERINQHRRCCGFIPELLHVSVQEFENCLRLESLIKWALKYSQSPRSCSSRVNGHEEWFAITEEMAVETVKLWENFVGQEKPYNSEGNLTIVWEYLLEKRSPSTRDIRTLDHKAQLERWAGVFASPTYEDYARAYLSYAGSVVRRLRECKPESYWQLATIIYSLWTLALCQNSIAFYALVLVLGCAGATLFPGSQFQSSGAKKKVNSPKKDTVKSTA